MRLKIRIWLENQLISLDQPISPEHNHVINLTLVAFSSISSSLLFGVAAALKLSRVLYKMRLPEIDKPLEASDDDVKLSWLKESAHSDPFVSSETFKILNITHLDYPYRGIIDCKSLLVTRLASNHEVFSYLLPSRTRYQEMSWTEQMLPFCSTLQRIMILK